MAIADRIPFGELIVGANTPVSVPTTEGEAEQAIHKVFELGVGADFFATLNVPLVRGREFAEHDLRPVEPSSTGSPSSPVPTLAAIPQTATPVVLNQTAARELFGDNEPIGARIRQGEKTYAVIGVTQDVKSGFMMANPVPTVFLPLSTDTLSHSSRATTVLIRGTPGRDSMSALRTELDSIDFALTIFDARTMDEHLGRFNEMIQWSSVINGGIGVLRSRTAAQRNRHSHGAWRETAAGSAPGNERGNRSGCRGWSHRLLGRLGVRSSRVLNHCRVCEGRRRRNG
jgi:hypothetical protein